jgi:hypothetical protein
MDERELRHRAAEASRLLGEPLLAEALNTILAEARNALETCGPDQLLMWQARAQAARALPDALREVVVAGPVAEPEPTDKLDPGTI